MGERGLGSTIILLQFSILRGKGVKYLLHHIYLICLVLGGKFTPFTPPSKHPQDPSFHFHPDSQFQAPPAVQVHDFIILTMQMQWWISETESII